MYLSGDKVCVNGVVNGEYLCGEVTSETLRFYGCVSCRNLCGSNASGRAGRTLPIVMWMCLCLRLCLCFCVWAVCD